MIVTARDGTRLHSRADGSKDGIPLVFANSLGTDLRLWDDLIPHLPDGLRLIRYDKRGHGQSDVPPAPYAMGTLISDAEAVMEAHEAREAVFVGLSIGGMIGQGLAVKRPDLVRALVLSNTAAKIATPDIWAARIDAVRTGGLEAVADAHMHRWFAPAFRDSPTGQLWRARFLETPAEGYVGCAAAISGTDFITPTSGLRLPALGIAGSEDGSTPPDLVRETTDLIPAAHFRLIRGAGHLPCIDSPEAYAETLAGFLATLPPI